MTAILLIIALAVVLVWVGIALDTFTDHHPHF